jgi:Putative zinc-finger
MMNCRRAEELLSDHLEGTLSAPLVQELEAHLAECTQCRELRRMLPDVVLSLHELGRAELDLPAGLVGRVAARSFGARVPQRVLRARHLSSAWQAAAVFLASVSLWMMFGSVSPASTQRLTTRIVERSANATAYVQERKDRVVEELRFLDVVLGTAFEERLDSMSERVEDYRKLLLRKREPPAPEKRSGSFSNKDARRYVRSDDAAEPRPVAVAQTGRTQAGQARPRQGART